LNRASAPTTQERRRGQVIGGGSMAEFANIAGVVARAAGVEETDIIISTSSRDQRPVLPGYFRTTKNWDFLIIQNRIPLVALEFKSIMSSVGNNLNNRAEEAVGQGIDLNTVLEANGISLGDFFSGYLMVMVDDPSTSRSKREVHLPLHDLPVVMNGLNYQQRGDGICHRLEDDGVWSCTSFTTTVLTQNTGDYSYLSESNSPERFFEEMYDFLIRNY